MYFDFALKANVNGRRAVDNATPLIIAAQTKNLKMMKMLLNRGAAVHAMDSDCDLAIHVSANRGHLEGIKLLMSRGSLANIGNIYLATPLMLASTGGYYSIVDYLLKNGVSMQYQLNTNRESELTLACCFVVFNDFKITMI